MCFNGGAPRAPFRPVRPVRPVPPVNDGVTVCVPGAVLAPAPSAAATGLIAKIDESPVFVDDSGSRKRLLRIAGVLIGLVSISFLAVVGVALAVPSSPRRWASATSSRSSCPVPRPRRRRRPR